MTARLFLSLVVLISAGCINFDGEGGAAHVFCLQNPGVCDPNASTGGGSAGGVGGVDVSTGTGGGTGADKFSADQIYIWGTLSEGACYLDAIASPTNPDVESTGFGCYDGGDAVYIRPTDGRVLFIASDNTVRSFTADPLKWESGRWAYPQDTLANDAVVVPREGDCNMDSGVTDFRIAPDTGDVHYRCGGYWHLPDGTRYPSDVSLIAVGRGGIRLVRESFEYKILTSTGSSTVTGLPTSLSFDARRVRSSGSGFHVLMQWTYNSPPELWEISSSGSATKKGTYSAPPARVSPSYSGWMLDGDGNLYGTTQLQDANFVDAIVKQPLEPGTSEIIYSEDAANGGNDWDDNKETFFVFLHISRLFSGP